MSKFYSLPLPDGLVALSRGFDSLGPTLEHLELSTNRIGSKGLTAMFECCTKLSALTKLRLGNNRLGNNATATQMMFGSYLSTNNRNSLEVLDLQGIDGEGLGENGCLSIAENLPPSLTTLHLEGLLELAIPSQCATASPSVKRLLDPLSQSSHHPSCFRIEVQCSSLFNSSHLSVSGSKLLVVPWYPRWFRSHAKPSPCSDSTTNISLAEAPMFDILLLGKTNLT